MTILIRWDVNMSIDEIGRNMLISYMRHEYVTRWDMNTNIVETIKTIVQTL